MNYLVTGGAGYIGSHMVKMLQEHNHDVTVIDNLSTGFKDLINDCEVINIDIKNKSLVDKSLSEKNYDGIFHFAAKSIVNESFKIPDEYRKNNVEGTMNLVESMKKYQVETQFSKDGKQFIKDLTPFWIENKPNPYKNLERFKGTVKTILLVLSI